MYKCKIISTFLLLSTQTFSQTNIVWSKEYDSPMVDVNSNLLKGTEIIDFAKHKGILYAASSNWNDPADRFKGQVIVKENSSASWKLDIEMQGRVSRASSIQSVIFKNDYNGQPLTNPDTMLFIGLTTHKGLPATYPGTVAWRDDSLNNWIYKDLEFTNHPFSRTEVRSMGFYRDKITNADIVFAGATPAPLGIFAGRYRTDIANNIVWDSVAEFLPINFERILGFTESDNVLYAATKSRILKRVDGYSVTTRWVELIDFTDAQYMSIYAPGMYSKYVIDEDIRSFRTYTAASQSNSKLMFTTFNRLFLYDPISSSLTEEVNLKNLLNTFTGNQYNYIQSGSTQDVVLPDNSLAQFIGIEAIFDTTFLKQNAQPNFAGIDTRGLIIMRQDSAGQINYYLLNIYDPNFANDTLTRVRSICPSPFTNEGNIIYAGGYASWGVDVENTAWIYKGEMQYLSAINEITLLKNELVVYPNPSSGKVIINTGTQALLKVNLFDSQLKFVRSFTTNDIDISNMSKGTYFINIETNKLKAIKKVILN